MSFIPSINETMSKREQFSALLSEALNLTELPKGAKKHSEEQVDKAKKEIVRFFPDLEEF